MTFQRLNVKLIRKKKTGTSRLRAEKSNDMQDNSCVRRHQKAKDRNPGERWDISAFREKKSYFYCET